MHHACGAAATPAGRTTAGAGAAATPAGRTTVAGAAVKPAGRTTVAGDAPPTGRTMVAGLSLLGPEARLSLCTAQSVGQSG